MSEVLMIKNLYNLEETIAAGIFEGKTYPWEVLPEIKTFIITLGESLPADKFDRREGKECKNLSERNDYRSLHHR